MPKAISVVMIAGIIGIEEARMAIKETFETLRG